MKRIHARISGKVQGVGFRASTRRKARKLGLTGWVRNLEDGDVEAVIEGTEESLEEMQEWLRKGPSLAHVEKLETEHEEPEGLEDFKIKR